MSSGGQAPLQRLVEEKAERADV
jgi:hypothetical protein